MRWPERTFRNVCGTQCKKLVTRVLVKLGNVNRETRRSEWQMRVDQAIRIVDAMNEARIRNSPTAMATMASSCRKLNDPVLETVTRGGCATTKV